MVRKTRKLRVGRICTRIYPDIGGPAKHTYYVSMHQGKIGVSNSVIACRRRTHSEDAYDWNLYELPIHAPALSSGSFWQVLFSICYVFLSFFTGLVYFLRNRVDVIHIHSPAITSISGYAISRIMNVPLIYTIHGLDGLRKAWSGSKTSIIQSIVERFVVSVSDAILVVSEEYTKSVAKYTKTQFIQSVSNGVDVTRFHPAKNDSEIEMIRTSIGLNHSDIVVMWIGNFNLSEKVVGVKDTIKAFNIASGKTSGNLRLVLVGDGIDYQSVFELVQQTSTRNQVLFLGYRKDVSEILKSTDIFVLASHNEGFPNALLEAMATGAACIVSNVGSMSTILGNTGVVIEPGNITDIGNAIVKLANDEAYRQEISNKTKERVESHFTWEKTAQDQIDVYKKLLRVR